MKKKDAAGIVLEVLRSEVDGDVDAAIAKMARDYSMTWMYRTRGGEVFPSTGKDVRAEMEDTYPIKRRRYDVRNVAVDDGVVMVELVESYPDPRSGKTYRTPLVLVLEMENGRIKKGRHYCDPQLSFAHLSQRDVERAFKGTASKLSIE